MSKSTALLDRNMFRNAKYVTFDGWLDGNAYLKYEIVHTITISMLNLVWYFLYDITYRSLKIKNSVRQIVLQILWRIKYLYIKKDNHWLNIVWCESIHSSVMVKGSSWKPQLIQTVYNRVSVYHYTIPSKYKNTEPFCILNKIRIPGIK